MKKTLKYYFIIIFIICLAVFLSCGLIIADEKGSAMLFGKEAETIKLDTEKISAELDKYF